jgi:hypothetical protein
MVLRQNSEAILRAGDLFDFPPPGQDPPDGVGEMPTPRLFAEGRHDIEFAHFVSFFALDPDRDETRRQSPDRKEEPPDVVPDPGVQCEDIPWASGFFPVMAENSAS